jgi:hypothetical protein
MSTVIVSIRTTKRPYSGDVIGYRLVAAERNNSGGMYAPRDKFQNRISFHKKFLVAYSSDFSQLKTAENKLSDFIRSILRRGRFTTFEQVG